MIWGNRSSAGRGRAVFCGPGLADRPEGAKEAWRLLLPAPSGRERGERAGARCRSRGILCQIKRIPLDNPEEKFWEGFRFPSQTHLETTKGRAEAPFGNHPGGWTGERGLRGTVGRGTGVRNGVLAAIQGVLPCGRRGWGRPGSSGADIGWLGTCGGWGAARRVVVPYGWLRKVSSTILGRGLAAGAAWRPGGWWGPPVGEGSRMGAFVPRPPPSGSSKKGPGPLPGFRRSQRKESGSFFAAACTWRKILLTERRVKRVRPLWGSDPFRATAEGEAPPAMPVGPRPSCRFAARGRGNLKGRQRPPIKL